jgi:hypothetical protein
VNVHQVQKDGIPYVGFEFACTWDEEHGLGVLMHGTRTVEIGGADTAFLLWLAEVDAEKGQSVFVKPLWLKPIPIRRRVRQPTIS